MVSPLATMGHLFTWSFSLVYKMLITCRMMMGKKNLISKRNQHHISSKYLTCQWSVSCGMNKPKQCSKAFPLYVCTSKGNVILISVIYRTHQNLRLGLLNMKMRYIKIFLNQCSIQGKQMIKYEIELARHILD